MKPVTRTVAVASRENDSVENPILERDPRWTLAWRAAGSSALSRAAQLRAILFYLVRQAILEPDEPIHESEIAHRVLGRRIDFNPLNDNIVRVQMSHLRKRLQLYFSTEGKGEEETISIAPGTYRAVFSRRIQTDLAEMQVAECALVGEPVPDRAEGSLGEDQAPEPESGSDRDASPVKRIWRLARTVVIGLAILAAAVLWVQNRAMKESMQRMRRMYSPWKSSPALASFWSEFVDSDAGTDVVMSDAFFKLAQRLGKRSFTLDDYLSRDFVQDLMAAEKSPDARDVLGTIASWRSANANHQHLARRILSLDPPESRIHVYFARDYRPELIRQDNVILLGSPAANPWDELFDSRLNFVVKSDSNLDLVVTNRAPAGGERGDYKRDDSTGYCVVAYMPNPSGKGKVLLIEGTSVEATDAGGDFLFSESQMSNLEKRLNGTSLPYFELLLKTAQVSGTPLAATIEAVRTYSNSTKR